jgi:hypothetical protein
MDPHREDEDDGASVGPDATVRERWDQVADDMEATAAEYRDEGWDVAEIHPGDVTVIEPGVADDRWGLDVLVADDEFGTVEQWVLTEDGSFDSCEVFHAEADGVVFAVVAMRDADAGRAILFPIYYDPAEATDTFRRAREEGAMHTHLRTLQADPVVTFKQSDPSLFVPDADGE